VRVTVFLNSLGLGGTEKAACRWAVGLQNRGHHVSLISLADGPRHRELDRAGVQVEIPGVDVNKIRELLKQDAPDVIHVHAPGHPHPGDVLGEALGGMSKIPVVQTNIFGHLENPKEDRWTDYRLFISWTSCVQAARRSFRPLNMRFFKRSSVAVYPVDPIEPAPFSAVREFRQKLGVEEDEVLFGRISRPDPVKWTPLAVDAFLLALAQNKKIKLLLREPPPKVARQLSGSKHKQHFVILPATADDKELLLTMSALDVVLHTSRLGESFGYGIAEPMNLGKPVITHSVPSLDQAQLELVRHGECGCLANIPVTMADAMLRLAGDKELRIKMGIQARQHIRDLANAEVSVSRLEAILKAAIDGRDNPFAADDLKLAREAASNLDANQFGHSAGEQWPLRLLYYRSRFHQFRVMIRTRFFAGARKAFPPSEALRD
jgi:glycosyltransferase involved in cell wall biosynthesis